jgi:hypothetical protein
MPDTLHDGNFLAPVTNGPRRYEYPFRQNGDRVSALFEQEYWQAVATFTPTELSVAHPTEPEFYLVKETEPVEFMAGLLKFVRTFARVPARQTEWSSFIIQMPEFSGAGAQQGVFFQATTANITDTANAWVTPNFMFAEGKYYEPIKNSPSQVATGNVITWSVPNHSFSNALSLVHIQGRPDFRGGVLFPAGTGSLTWQYVNANAINITYAAATNYGANDSAFVQYSRGSFGTGSRYLRCRRITDFYLPGVSPGIATEADIPLPPDQSNSVEFIDALFVGTGDINVQVGELTRWRGSPIYQITKTVIDVLDIL